SEQESVQAETNLAAAKANVQSLEDQVKATEADLSSAIARTHQASAARSTVTSTLADLANAEEQKKQAEVRLGYTKIYAPVTGTGESAKSKPSCSRCASTIPRAPMFRA